MTPLLEPLMGMFLPLYPDEFFQPVMGGFGTSWANTGCTPLGMDPRVMYLRVPSSALKSKAYATLVPTSLVMGIIILLIFLVVVIVDTALFLKV
jgi:hypothetical protein